MIAQYAYLAIGAITAIIVLDHATICQTASIDCLLDTMVVSSRVHEVLSTASGSAAFCLHVNGLIDSQCCCPSWFFR